MNGGLLRLDSCCGRPEIRNSVSEGLRDMKLEDIQLDTLVIVFSRWCYEWNPELRMIYVVRRKRHLDSFEISIYSNCIIRFKCFWFHVRRFDFRLNSHRNVHRAMLQSAAVTSASSKINAATFNLLPNLIYALWFNGHIYHIFTKHFPHHLYFRWRNPITSWTISNLSTSFHHALMALGIRRSAMG